MANHHQSEASSDDFFEHFLGIPNYAAPDTELAGNDASQPSPAHMILQLNSGDGVRSSGGGFHGAVFPLGLSLDQGNSNSFMKTDEASSGSGKRFREEVVDGRVSTMNNVFHSQPRSNSTAAVHHQPAIRPRVRARRGQATDPHSIAERLRRERIAERIRALQELVPSLNKTDRAAMLDEVVDYVKFLRLQVKVLSMSRLGGAGAVAPLVTDISISSVEDEANEGGRNQPAWEKWSTDGTERQVVKLMEENVGTAMQFLQTKALCLMPISLASAIYHTQTPDSATFIKPKSNPPS